MTEDADEVRKRFFRTYDTLAPTFRELSKEWRARLICALLQGILNKHLTLGRSTLSIVSTEREPKSKQFEVTVKDGIVYTVTVAIKTEGAPEVTPTTGTGGKK